MTTLLQHLGRFTSSLAVLVLMVATLRPASGAVQTLNGDPLRISADDTLSMKVLRDEISVSNTSGVPAYERQYFNVYNTYLRRTVNDVTTLTAGDGYTPSTYTPVSNSSTDVAGLGTAGTITTAVTTSDGIAITQVVRYVNGQDLYQHTWTVTNTSQTTFTGVALRYGGDAFFFNSDAANGFFDPGLGMVFCTNPNSSGLMGIFGGANTPATHHFESGFSANEQALGAAADLPDTVNPSFIDNGMSLQWDHGDLGPGQSFVVVAFEKWTAAGLIQVLAPAQVTATVGTSLNLTFSVRNLQSSADTANLTVSGSAGLTVSAPSSVALAASGASDVVVAVTVGGAAQDTIATVTLTATAASNGALVNSDVGRISVGNPSDNTPPPPTAAAVTIPPIGVSVGNAVAYAAICPSTSEGAARLVATLAGLTSTQAVGFAWDATTQAYVRLPDPPTGGVLPTTGVYIATRRDLGLDFNGTPATLPAAIVLQPGFNFIGIPPLDTGNGILTTHAFPGDFAVLNESGALVTTTSEFADLLGTVGSDDPTTAQPFLYNGSTYDQQAVMVTGRGYFLKNNASSPITLRRVASGTILSDPTLAPQLTIGQVVRSVPVKHTYIDRGTPPPAPAASSTAAASNSGKACGLGSGVVGLLGLLVLAWRRRFH